MYGMQFYAKNAIHLLSLLSDVSDVKVMTSTVAVIFAITWVVNNYNIRIEQHFLNWTEQTHSEPSQEFWKNCLRNDL